MIKKLLAEFFWVILISAYAKSDPKHNVSMMIFDLTVQLNKLMSKNISNEDFILKVESSLSLSNSRSDNNTAFYYAADSETLDEFVLKIMEVTKVMNEKLEKNGDLDIVFSWSGNIPNIIHASKQKPDWTNTSASFESFIKHQREKQERHSSWEESYIFDKDELDLDLPNLALKTNRLPNIRISIIYNLYKTECYSISNQDTIAWGNLIMLTRPFFKATFNHEVLTGIGYDEDLIDCQYIIKNCRFHALLLESNIVVWKTNFQNTSFVPESYGLFERDMSFLHRKNLELYVKNHKKCGSMVAPFHSVGRSMNPFPNLEMIYFPISVDEIIEAYDETNNIFSSYAYQYHKLLINYGDVWANEVYKNRHMMVQIVADRQNTSLSSDLKQVLVTPFISGRNCFEGTWTKSDTVELTQIVLDAAKQGFKTVIVTHEQWKVVNSAKAKAIFDKTEDPSSTEQLEYIVDYSIDVGQPDEKPCQYNWTLVEQNWEELDLLDNRKQTKPILKSIILQFNWDGNSQSFSSVFPEGSSFTQKIPENLDIGCSVPVDDFFSNTKMVGLVPAFLLFTNHCKKMNGTFYILKLSTVEIIFGMTSENYLHDYYEQYIRRIFYALVIIVRLLVMKEHPESMIYIQFNSVEPSQAQELQKKDEEYLTSLFCNRDVLHTSFVFNDIVNFAVFNNIPLVLNTALTLKDAKTSEIYNWFSFMRRMNYPAMERSTDPTLYSSSNEERLLNFTLRNYPNERKYPKMYTCVPWIENMPELKMNFFQNNYIGAVFSSNSIRQAELSVNVDEYSVMLQFIFHRFHLLKLEIGSNFRNVLQALKNSIKVKSDMKTTIFLSYVVSDGESKQLKSFLKTFQNNFKYSKNIKLHLDLSEYLQNDSERDKAESNFLEVNTADPEKIISMVDSVKNSKAEVGLELNLVQGCAKFIETFPNSPGSLKLFHKIDYLVCNQKIASDFLGEGRKKREKFFDNHLKTKLALNHFLPHLKVYFSLEVEVNLNETIGQYLKLLSQFEKFGAAYDISYFMVEAFDREQGCANGWWRIKDFKDLGNPKVYDEKEPVGGHKWYPNVISGGLIQKENFKLTIIISSVSCLLLTIVVATALWYFVGYKKLRQFLSPEEVKEFLNGRSKSITDNDSIEMVESNEPECMKFDTQYNLPLSDINIDEAKVLGAGNFGTVYKGMAKGVPVAIKKPKLGCPKSTFKSFLSEVKVLCYIGHHENVVAFFGAYTKEIHKGFLYIATELCSQGSLEGLLRAKKSVVSKEVNSIEEIDLPDALIYFADLHRFAMQVSSGMKYIESKQVVHGDLSTRNVLLDENMTCKIGDFGLSRKLYEYQKYVKESQKPLPWKWMAIESLTKMEFTSKSDVWSFGVTLWEIYSLGDSPYGGRNWTIEFADELRSGLRLTIPRFASDDIYAKMMECWNLDPKHRPNFIEMVSFFAELGNAEYMTLEES